MTLVTCQHPAHPIYSVASSLSISPLPTSPCPTSGFLVSLLTALIQPPRRSPCDAAPSHFTCGYLRPRRLSHVCRSLGGEDGRGRHCGAQVPGRSDGTETKATCTGIPFPVSENVPLLKGGMHFGRMCHKPTGTCTLKTNVCDGVEVRTTPSISVLVAAEVFILHGEDGLSFCVVHILVFVHGSPCAHLAQVGILNTVRTFHRLRPWLKSLDQCCITNKRVSAWLLVYAVLTSPYQL